MTARPERVVGIDPGLSGAVALLQEDCFVGVWDIPLLIDDDGRKAPCALATSRLLSEIKPDLVVIEQVNAMPSAPGKNGQRRTMGAQSMFNFGRGFGLVEAAATINKLRIEYTRPASWKRRCGLINAHKDIARLRAQEQWPQAQHELRLKKHHGRAEALLIARYGHTHW